MRPATRAEVGDQRSLSILQVIEWRRVVDKRPKGSA